VRGTGSRLLRAQVGLLGVGVLEAADADADGWMVLGDLEAVLHQLRASARDAVEAAVRVVEDGVAHVRRHRGDEHEHRRCENDQQQGAPAPREHRGQGDAGDQRQEARLREREDQSRPGRGDRGHGQEHDADRAPEERDDQARQDGHDQEAPVDRRVPEDGVDAEEGCVGVADEQLRIPEDVAVDPLLDPDHGEDDRHQGQLGVEHDHPAAAPVEAGEHDGQQAEGEVEGEQLDRALAHVLAPGEGEAAPGDEGGERQCDGTELSGAGVSLEQLPGEHQSGGGDHGVQRHEQVRLRRADGHRDPRGNAGERRQGEQPRPAAKQRGSGGGEGEPGDGAGRQQCRVALRGEVDGKGRSADRPGGERGQPLRPPGSDQQRR